jgi:hypothetical protein
LALLVAEFDKCGGIIKRFDDSADLASDKPVFRQIAEKRNGGEQSRVVALFRLDLHLSIRHVSIDQLPEAPAISRFGALVSHGRARHSFDPLLRF